MAQEYEKRFAQLNNAQKEAVISIEGPLMVVAGPGTGKTEVLAMRAANILKSTDVLPSNILCLTFTESGARAMRQRLFGLVGADAYKIAVHTFHSFGSEIIGSHPEYFYDSREVYPTDELTSFEILRRIVASLPLGDPLRFAASTDDSRPIKDVRKAVSALKQAGLTPEELLDLIEQNQAFATAAEPVVREAWPIRLNAKKLSPLESLGQRLTELAKQRPNVTNDIYPPLGRVMAAELERAIEATTALGKTGPLASWRSRWLEKDVNGQWIMKDRRQSPKLRSLAKIYGDYLDQLHRRGLYDFDDMILEALKAIKRHPDLLYNLQERYLYVMVDEFQDTNGSQLQLVKALGDNPVNEGRPNIMVVGDDDQAIYAFQGADISNILNFNQSYQNVKTIVLKHNYRSAEVILKAARQIITQGQDRLEGRIADINKQLSANYQPRAPHVELRGFDTPHQEYYWVGGRVAELIGQGVAPGQIAVISRKHNEIKRLAAYFQRQGTPVFYQHQDDALAHPLVNDLWLAAGALVAVSTGNHAKADELIAELLAHPAFGVKPEELFALSLSAWRQKKPWLELMLGWPSPRIQQIGDWLANTAPITKRWPMELCLDLLTGKVDGLELDLPAGGDFVSPLGNYYFNQTNRDRAAAEYLRALNALISVRSRVHRRLSEGGELKRQLKTADFIATLEAYRQADLTIPINGETALEESGPQQKLVNLMTAHQSKGLEFEYVFITNLNDNIWGSSRRPANRRLSLPKNLPIMPAGDSDDERLRLLYVAMTRSRSCLQMTYHRRLEPSGKISDLAAYLAVTEINHAPQSEDAAEPPPAEAIRAARQGWLSELISPTPSSLPEQLSGLMQDYSLSATHLEGFLNLRAGGPSNFLLRHLLRFPKAPSAELAFGIAVHAALKEAHAHLNATGRRLPPAKVADVFKRQLKDCALPPGELSGMLKTGAALLLDYLKNRYQSFNPGQLAERDFANQHSRLGEARLIGKIDVMEVDHQAKSIKITDYKTGKPLSGWQASNQSDQLKLHMYELQLMFYKLLVENSRDFSGYRVGEAVIEFIRPDASGRAVCLNYRFDENELVRFKKLLRAVWRRINGFDFPDTTPYKPSLSGVRAFEDDLIKSLPAD